MIVSIILCTCNRANDLQQTLAAIAQLHVPKQMPTELLVVDNASTDATAEVVASCHLPNMSVRYIHEPRQGKGYAYNAGMAAAQGEVFLFTDDDVRPPKNWIEGMCGPILRDEAEAMAGGVRLATHLERPWMKTLHRNWLASTEGLDADKPNRMVGANMAFSRKVLTKVPQFNVELGPGAMGFGDETLFTWELFDAGYRLRAALETVVVHHCDASRLSRAGFITTAEKFGRVSAYVAHHYYHSHNSFCYVRLLKHIIQLVFLRAVKAQECSREGMPLWEMELVQEINFHKQWLIERRRPRYYQKADLIKSKSS